MFRRLLLLTLRNLRRNLLYTAIVIGGLSIGITTFLTIIQWTAWHRSYDRHIVDGENIYRISLKENLDNFERHTARIIHGDVVHQLYSESEIAEIVSIARLAPFRNAVVSKDEIVFYEEKVFECDPEFLEMFQPEMVIGNRQTALSSPKKVILSERTAKKYFGESDPVGQTLDITHQFGYKPENYEISGVFRNFPANTHFNIELLTSFENPEEFNSSAWVYLLMSENADIRKVEDLIKEFILDHNEEDYYHGVKPEIMRLFDIHMKSHLARELEHNVQIQTIFILFIAGLMVFLLAWFNFTLLSISQNQLNLRKLIYQWQVGSGKTTFFKQFFIEFFTIGIISFLTALLLSFLLSRTIKNMFEISLTQNSELLVFSILLILIIIILSSLLTSFYATRRLYSAVKKRHFSGRGGNYNPVSSKNFFIRAIIVLEFIITFVIISNLLMIRAQVNYSIRLQIGSNDSTTIQIPSLPRPVIDKYAVFRDELKKFPVFEEVTAMMESPGGMAMDAFTFTIEGLPKTEDRLYVFPVDENFVRFYDLEIIAGRDFPPQYNTDDTTEFYMLNETAAKLIGGDDFDDIIGRELDLDFAFDGFIYPGNIIGVIKDFHLSSMESSISPMVIFPEYTWLYCFSLRIKGNQQQALTVLRDEWRKFFPEYPLRYYFTTEIYRDLYKTQLSEIRVLLIFGILSLLIAGTGLFSLSGFFMQQKMHAAAIRKINGAKMSNILIPELLQYLYLSLIATLIALPLSLYSISKWLDNFSYQTAISWLIFAGIFFALILFSWLAVLYHALKLSKANPADFIRGE